MTRILVVSAGNEPYRRYVLEAVAAAGVAAELIDSKPLRRWALPFVETAHELDLDDVDEVRRRAKGMHAREPFDGVLTYDETRVELAALVAMDLGLPGISPETAAKCRDKRLMREAFREAGVPSARSVLALDVTAALAAAERIGYPVVIKPRRLGGSKGVVLVHDARQLREQFSVADDARDARIEHVPGVLVEEYLLGPEYSVEAVVQAGRVRILGVTAKEVGYPPYFEELGHTCANPLSHVRYGEIARVVEAAHRALGIDYGATHAELRLGSDGPRMIEIAARLGGDKIPWVTGLATGVDLVALTIASLTGGPISVPRFGGRVAGIRMIYPDHDGRVVRLGHRPGAEELWEELVWHAEPGQEMLLPPRGFMTRLGHVIATADSVEELRGKLDACVDALVIEIEIAGVGHGQV